MPGNNEILPFCPTDSGTNLLTQAEYLAATDRTTGNAPGIASLELVNKALRQSSIVAAAVAQFIADLQADDVVDDLSVPTLASMLSTAVKAAAYGAVTTVNLANSPFVLTADDVGLVLLDATAGNVSVTLPAVTAFDAPMEFMFVRIDATANTATVNRAGADTFLGGATSFTLSGQSDYRVVAGDATSVWVTVGAQSNANSSEIQPITATVAASALTLGHAGAVPISYRNPSLASGAVTRVTGGALSLVVPSGATLGSIAATPFRLWLAKVLDAGVEYLAVMNTQVVTGTDVDIVPVTEDRLISTTAMSAAADSAGVWYSEAAHANCPMRLVGYVEMTQAAAGTYATAPSVIQGAYPGLPKPGERLQLIARQNATFTSTGTIINYNNTIPAVTDGVLVNTCAVVARSAVNIIRAWSDGQYGTNLSGLVGGLAIFADAVCKKARAFKFYDSGDIHTESFFAQWQAGSTASVTVQHRAGQNSANSLFFNGNNATRLLGGAQSINLFVEEIQA